MSLGKVYYDQKHPAGFGSVAKLAKANKNTKRDVEVWLSFQNTYTFHNSVRKKFPRNPYAVTNIDVVLEIDFMDISSLSKYKYKYLLNIIYIFSRDPWSLPVKDKTGTSITSALKSLFQDRKPITIQSDKGTGFVNATMQQYVRE